MHASMSCWRDSLSKRLPAAAVGLSYLSDTARICFADFALPSAPNADAKVWMSASIFALKPR